MNKKRVLFWGCILAPFFLNSCSYKSFEDWLRGEGTLENVTETAKGGQEEDLNEEDRQLRDQGVPSKPQRELGEDALPNAGYYEIGDTISYSYQGEIMKYTLKTVEVIENPVDSRINKSHFFDGEKDVERWKAMDQELVLVTAEIENISTEPNTDYGVDRDGNAVWHIFGDLGYEEELKQYSKGFAVEARYFSEYAVEESDPRKAGWMQIPIGEKKEVELGWLVDKDQSEQVMYWGLGADKGDRIYFFRLGSTGELK